MTETNPDVCDRLFAGIPPGPGSGRQRIACSVIVNRVMGCYEHLPTLDNFLGHRHPQRELLHILRQEDMCTSSIVVIYIRAIPWQPWRGSGQQP